MTIRPAHLAVAFLPMFSLPAAAAPLEPLTPWKLDYGETKCIAMREYGASDRPLTLAIIPSPDGQTYQLLVALKRHGPAYAEELQGSVDFGSGPVKAWVLHYSSEDKKIDLFQYRISETEMFKARSSKAVTLRAASWPNIALPLDVMPALLDGLKTCTSDLQEYWNMNLKGEPLVASPATGDVRTLFTADDYPAEAIKKKEQGTAQYILLINEKGSVAGCDLLKPSGVSVLDAVGCAIITQRAKFKPALDTKGKPVRSSVVSPPVTWHIAG